MDQARLFPQICVYCDGPAQGNHSIHRDGPDTGPEVPLCDVCGADVTPTLAEIWDKIAPKNWRELIEVEGDDPTESLMQQFVEDDDDDLPF